MAKNYAKGKFMKGKNLSPHDMMQFSPFSNELLELIFVK